MSISNAITAKNRTAAVVSCSVRCNRNRFRYRTSPTLVSITIVTSTIATQTKSNINDPRAGRKPPGMATNTSDNHHEPTVPSPVYCLATRSQTGNLWPCDRFDPDCRIDGRQRRPPFAICWSSTFDIFFFDRTIGIKRSRLVDRIFFRPSGGMADAQDLKSCGRISRAGSTPASAIVLP